eukprot:comp9409_c0_seq1/m.4459 comp9409_c0_seq1/g.4459  ORF comp9409_c0_seq1/g.4459 comp9409_c0_seq1/m.4459 type:complete len:210 (-) comp9409_c0_seq1:838-1467(-)
MILDASLLQPNFFHGPIGLSDVHFMDLDKQSKPAKVQPTPTPTPAPAPAPAQPKQQSCVDYMYLDFVEPPRPQPKKEEKSVADYMCLDFGAPPRRRMQHLSIPKVQPKQDTDTSDASWRSTCSEAFERRVRIDPSVYFHDTYATGKQSEGDEDNDVYDRSSEYAEPLKVTREMVKEIDDLRLELFPNGEFFGYKEPVVQTNLDFGGFFM